MEPLLHPRLRAQEVSYLFLDVPSVIRLLAIGVIIGAAFGRIIASLTDNILTPLIGLFASGDQFENLTFTIGDAVIQYGLLISALLNFLLVALILFLFVKLILRLRKKEDVPNEPAKPEDPADITILKEIRDELKRQNDSAV